MMKTDEHSGDDMSVSSADDDDEVVFVSETTAADAGSQRRQQARQHEQDNGGGAAAAAGAGATKKKRARAKSKQQGNAGGGAGANNDNDNDNINSNDSNDNSITDVQSLAITILSRGMHALEFVQRYATSSTSIPTSCACPQDSALGVGLGLGLDRCRTMVEDLAVRLIDVVVALGEDRIGGCGTGSGGGGAGSGSGGGTAATNVLPPNPYQRRQAGLGSVVAGGEATNAIHHANTTGGELPIKCDHLSTATKDALRSCSISLLSVLFRADYADWALPSSPSLSPNHSHKQHQQKLERMCKVLLSQAQRIGRDPHDRTATETSAASLSLLVLLNTKWDGTVLDERRILDVSTIDAILSSVFPAAGSRLPSRAAKDESLGRIAAQLLTDVASGRGEGHAAFQGNHLSGALGRAWPIIVGCHREGILDQRVEGLETVLVGLLALHSSSGRALVRRSLKDFLGMDTADDSMLTDDDTPVTHNTQHRRPSDRSLQASSCDKLVTSLLLLARHDSFGVSSLALGLLRSLLDQPPCSNGSDDLGQKMWTSIEQSRACAGESSKFVQNTLALLQYVASTAFDEGMNGDSAKFYAPGSYWRGNNPVFVRFMPRICVTLDAMLVLAGSNSFIRRITTFIGDDICDSPDDIAASFLLPCDSENQSDLMRALTFSGGSILARVATSALKTAETDVTAKEMLVAIKKILRHSMTSPDGTIMNAFGDSISEGISCDGVLRAHRFQRVIGEVIEDCDTSIAASTYASCSSVVLDAQRAQNQVSEATRKMKQMEERLEQIWSERDSLLYSIDSLRASHAKDVARTKAAAEANAADTKELLLEEKRRAENQARQYHGRMIQAEEQYQKASALKVEACTNLDQAKAAISELSQRYEELEIQAKDEAERKVMAEEEAQELKQNLEEVERELNEKSEDLSELEKEHNSASDALQMAESSNSELRKEMEDAYSRLVSLAQLFQVKEDDLSKANTTNRDELRRARREAEDLASKRAVAEERADAIERENDELRRKMTRLKKEFEKERSRKANGPVGYFNKLHDDFEEKESVRRERSERSERRSGKENGDRESSRSRSRASSRARDGAESQRRFHIAR
mmetsp:Transcript_11764/g.33526  ORF Transcript_11764/g.33526 Transcript_11764/m.33526 type:complete len:1096 (+) Transcript_11764:222-3509(+)